MSIKNLRFSFIILALFVFAGTAAAQGTVTAPELTMNATVTTTMQLTLVSNGAGVALTGSRPDYIVSFGNVNGYALGTPTVGVTATANGTGAFYMTPITVTPLYSGFTTETARIAVDDGAGTDQALAREGVAATSGIVATGLDVITGAADASANTRYVGFFIPRVEAAGAKSAILVYSVIVD